MWFSLQTVAVFHEHRLKLKERLVPKFILQRETNKKQEKCFKIAMEIDIPTVHLKDNMWEL